MAVNQDEFDSAFDSAWNEVEEEVLASPAQPSAEPTQGVLSNLFTNFKRGFAELPYGLVQMNPGLPEAEPGTLWSIIREGMPEVIREGAPVAQREMRRRRAESARASEELPFGAGLGAEIAGSMLSLPMTGPTGVLGRNVPAIPRYFGNLLARRPYLAAPVAAGFEYSESPEETATKIATAGVLGATPALLSWAGRRLWNWRKPNPGIPADESALFLREPRLGQMEERLRFAESLPEGNIFTGAQITQSPTAEELMRKMTGRPGYSASRIVDERLDPQNLAIERRVNALPGIDAPRPIHRTETGPFDTPAGGLTETGRGIRERANEIVQGPIIERSAATEGLYRAAESSNAPARVEGILDQLEARLDVVARGSNEGQSIVNTINKIRTELPEGDAALPSSKLQSIKSDIGQAMREIQESKFSSDPGVANEVRKLNNLYQPLVDALNESSQAYRIANDLYREMSPEVESALSSRFADFARGGKRNRDFNLVDRIFDPARMPRDEMAKFAREMRRTEAGADAMDRAVAFQLEKRMSPIRGTASRDPVETIGNVNYPTEVLMAMRADEPRMDLLWEAMTPAQKDAYRELEKLAKLSERGRPTTIAPTGVGTELDLISRTQGELQAGRTYLTPLHNPVAEKLREGMTEVTARNITRALIRGDREGIQALFNYNYVAPNPPSTIQGVLSARAAEAGIREAARALSGSDQTRY